MTVTVELTIGETLKLWRDRVGLSQKQLGAAIELGRTTVIRYEADTALPKWKDVQAWAALCGEDAEILRPAWDYARMSGWIYGADPPQPALFERDDRGRLIPAVDLDNAA